MLPENHSAISGSAFTPLLRCAQIFAALALASLAILPTSLVSSGPTVCLFKNIFGVECYGCGLTRALSFLLHGDLHLALAFNRGSVVVLPMLAVLASSAAVSHRQRGSV